MRWRPVMRRTLGLAALGLALMGTSACVRLGSEPPERLLGIATQARLTPGAGQSAAPETALFVEMPTVPRMIATQRIAVRANPTSYAYVAKALWVDTPARQFQSMLSETIAVNTGRLVLDPGQYTAHPGQVLNGELLEFGIDAQAGEAIVTYDATLLASDGQTVRRQRFSASRPVATINGDSVAPAISEAANDVAGAVAAWVGKP